ncbi:MAG: hypothetical protein ACNA7I_06225 [Candidatus Methanoperedens sp.]
MKKGVNAKSSKMLTVRCTVCGTDMECPESMLEAKRHFCARCTDLLAEGYEPDELKMSPDDIAQHFEKCDEVSMLLMDFTFDSYWKNVQEHGMEYFDPENESLARDCYLQGATSMLALLISAGMPPEFLDELGEGIREAKMRRGEGK